MNEPASDSIIYRKILGMTVEVPRGYKSMIGHGLIPDCVRPITYGGIWKSGPAE